jgi:hypothetical protein
VGDIDFEVISAAENSNKFQKARFWKEKSVEDLVFAHISNLLHGLHIRNILPFHSQCAFFSTFRSVMYGVVCLYTLECLDKKQWMCTNASCLSGAKPVDYGFAAERQTIKDWGGQKCPNLHNKLKVTKPLLSWETKFFPVFYLLALRTKARILCLDSL